MTETWMPVFGYEGLYECNYLGVVRRLTRKVIKRNGVVMEFKGGFPKPAINGKGYVVVCLIKDGVRKNHKVHRIVATAFISGPPSRTHQVNHIDGNKMNNHFQNLEWVTPWQNIAHAHANGLSNSKGKRHSSLNTQQGARR